MVRTFVPGAGALALGLGLVVVSGGGPAGATQVPVQFSGAVHCTAFGLFMFSPRLTNGSAPDTIALRATMGGCTGAGTSQSGVTLVSGKLLATAATTTTSCGAVLGGSTLPDFTGTITWKAHGGLAVASTVSVSGGSVFFNSGTDTVTTYVTPTVTSGSFASESLHFTDLVASVSGYKVSASCGAHGLGSLRFGKQSGSIVGSVDVGA